MIRLVLILLLCIFTMCKLAVLLTFWMNMLPSSSGMKPVQCLNVHFIQDGGEVVTSQPAKRNPEEEFDHEHSLVFLGMFLQNVGNIAHFHTVQISNRRTNNTEPV
jgi:hypothetical protein